MTIILRACCHSQSIARSIIRLTPRTHLLRPLLRAGVMISHMDTDSKHCASMYHDYAMRIYRNWRTCVVVIV